MAKPWHVLYNERRNTRREESETVRPQSAPLSLGLPARPLSTCPPSPPPRKDKAFGVRRSRTNDQMIIIESLPALHSHADGKSTVISHWSTLLVVLAIWQNCHFLSLRPFCPCPWGPIPSLQVTLFPKFFSRPLNNHRRVIADQPASHAFHSLRSSVFAEIGRRPPQRLFCVIADAFGGFLSALVC